MRKFGLIGYPLGHSFSQAYFTEKFRREGITGCRYDNYPINDIALLPQLIKTDFELSGLNVTIPHKSEVFRFLDDVDAEAKEIGAVNVIKIRRQEGRIKLTGFNSDVTGIFDSLSPYFNPDVSEAIVLGTGGSSRAVCHVLRRSGIKITLVSRTSRPGVISYDDLDAGCLRRATIIVNTTPLGMFPDTGKKPDIDYSALTNRHVLFDLVYNPELTLFLQSGMKQGCTVVTGLKMLHRQAEKAWEIWNDEKL
jgi:shikimate dehydrogenase